MEPFHPWYSKALLGVSMLLFPHVVFSFQLLVSSLNQEWFLEWFFESGGVLNLTKYITKVLTILSVARLTAC